jgi:hypothetical protein
MTTHGNHKHHGHRRQHRPALAQVADLSAKGKAHSAAGIRKIASICRKLLSAVGFS